MSAGFAVRSIGLTKRYGSMLAVDDLNLTVLRGEIFGLLGPNGAGKTTTIRLALDLIRPSAGRIEVFETDVRASSAETRRRIGYLPGDVVLPERMTARQLLAYLGGLRGGVDPRETEQLAERLGLALDRRIGDLSKGNRQKVAVVQAFHHRPDLYILDEPTSGLDPLVQHSFHELVRDEVARGATVLLSSHVLSEVQHLADRVGIIRAGRLVDVRGVDDLRAGAVRRVDVHFAGPVDREAFTGIPGVRDVVVDGARLRCVLVGEADALIKSLAARHVRAVTFEEPDVEEIFLHLYQGQPHGT